MEAAVLMAGMKIVRSGWDRTLLVCGKCSKKIGGGFGPNGKQPLAKALRKELHLKKGRKASMGIVEVKCLGICPKNAVTVIDGRDGHEWKLVQAGAAMDDVLTGLDLCSSALVQPGTDIAEV